MSCVGSSRWTGFAKHSNNLGRLSFSSLTTPYSQSTMPILRSHTSNSSVHALAAGLPHIGSDWASDGYADVHVDENEGGDNDAASSDDDEGVAERPRYNTRLQERLRLARKPPPVSLTAQTSILDRVAGGRGYAGPLFGADAPSRRLVEVPIGDGYVFFILFLFIFYFISIIIVIYPFNFSFSLS